MKTGFWIALGGGLAIAALLFGGVVYWRGTDQVAPAGQILKVRSVPADEQHSLVVLDLRIANNSDVALEARQITIVLATKDGTKLKGTLVSGVDSKQLFSYYPALGEAYNEPLIAGSRISPHGTADFMLAARVDVPEQDLSARRELSVSVQDRTGAVAELLEKRK